MKVKRLRQMLDDLIEGADEMELAFFVEVDGRILEREIYIPSMATMVKDRAAGKKVEVWLTEKMGAPDETDDEREV